MELFKEFSKNEIYYSAIENYLKNNLDKKLIEKLKNPKKPIILTGKNEILGQYKLVPFSPFSLEDYNLFKSIVQDKEIMKTTSLFKSNIPTEKQAINNFLLKSISHIFFNIGVYKIYQQSTNKLCGLSGVNVTCIDFINMKPKEISIAFYLKYAYQGKRLAYDTTKIVLDYSLKKYSDLKVWATALPSNIASHKTLLKLGLSFVKKLCKYNKGFPVNYYEKINQY
jgi:RimJ/RimL family protein N-acetyltransferase